MSSVPRPNVSSPKSVEARPVLRVRHFSVDECRHDEDWANALSHAIGCLLSVIAGYFLLVNAATHGTAWQLFGCLVYTGSLTSVYAASTMSHWSASPTWRRRFRMWDQGLIYLLIAGTYTPFAIGYLSGPWQLVTVLMWACALTGFVSKVALEHRIDGIAVWLYLGLGWLPIVAMPELIEMVPRMALRFVFAGGVAYSLGSLLLMNDHRVRYLHVGWHLFVIAGSALHYLAIWKYVIPVA